MTDINSSGSKLTPMTSNWVNQVTDSQGSSEIETSMPPDQAIDSVAAASTPASGSPSSPQQPSLATFALIQPQQGVIDAGTLAKILEIIYETLATFPEIAENAKGKADSETEVEIKETDANKALTIESQPSSKKGRINLAAALAEASTAFEMLLILGDAKKGVQSNRLFNALVRFAKSELRQSLNILLLIKELEDIKETGMQSISTGKRFILGDHPDLALKLVRAGIKIPTVGGGPYDGMAKKAAAAGEPPYDKPVYAALAEALPVGWEEVSASEIDQMISQLKDSMSMPPAIAAYSLFSTLAETSLEAAALIFKPILKKEPELLNMMMLRNELQDLKENGIRKISTGDRLILGERPDLMMQLTLLDMLPPTVGGGPYDGMAKEAANSTPPIPPYDNPLYAAMANALPSGWEELSASELDQVITKLDQAINEKMANIVISAALPPLVMNMMGFPSIQEDIVNLLALDILKNFFNPLNVSDTNLEQEPKPLNGKRIARQLLESIAIIQSLNFLLGTQPSSDLTQTGRQMIEQWLTNQMAERLVGDLFGFSGTTPTERNLMAQTLVAYALTTTLMNTQPSIPAVIAVLDNLTQDPAFASYADIARSLLNEDQIEEEQATQGLMQNLTASSANAEEGEQQWLVLPTLLTTMLQQILGIKTQASESDVGTSPINPTTGERPSAGIDTPV